MVEKHEPYKDPIELLQGTLDLLVLQTLTWGPQHGYGITAAIKAGSSTPCRSTRDRSTPPSTGWSGTAPWPRNGRPPRTSSASRSTG